MEGFVNELKNAKILPIKCPKDKAELDSVMAALQRTEIRIIEITLRGEFALEAIKLIKTNFPEFTVGAGTVVNPEALASAIAAGADFCVSPGLDLQMLTKAKEKGIPFLPGCSTPLEILAAQTSGLRVVKFFPAEISGGVKALKLYAGAFSNMLFLPTGGITEDNLVGYLNCENVIACGGSFMLTDNSDETYKKIIKCLEAAE